MDKVYKVLVADDEYWIRENLRTIIQWEEYNFIFMEPAIDGNDVIHKMSVEAPDILIIDINMPFKNGVEVITLIKERYPDVVPIVLSGYSDFDYVRESLLAGAIDYLLKPLTKMNLINVLSKAIEIINQRIDSEREKLVMEEKLLRASSILYDQELSSMIIAEEISMVDRSTVNKVLEIDLDFIGFHLALIKITPFNIAPKIQEDSQDSYISYSIKKIIGRYTNNEKTIIFNNMYVPNEFILIADIEKEKLNTICDCLIEELYKFTSAHINIAISSYYYSLKKMHDAYSEAESTLMLRKYILENAKMWAYDIKDSTIQKRMTTEIENQLIFAIQNQNRKLVRQLIFKDIGLKNCQKNGWLYIEVKQTVDRIIGILFNTTMQSHSSLEILAIDNLIEIVNKNLEAFNIEEVCNGIEQIIDEYLDLVVTYTDNDTIKSTVRLAARYIQENYFEDLSLSSLSKQFHVESSYFSRVFKKEMGDNLMLYIAKRRIEKAIELINKKELSLTEISYLVGYDDYSYFNRVFRKITGKSPSEYKSN